jgi:hypothetical protein
VSLFVPIGFDEFATNNLMIERIFLLLQYEIQILANLASSWHPAWNLLASCQFPWHITCQLICRLTCQLSAYLPAVTERMPRNSTLPLVDPANEDGVVVVTSQVPIPINPNNLACLSRASPFVKRKRTENR